MPHPASPSTVDDSSRKSVSFARDLAAYADLAALITDDEVITYGDLAARVEATSLRLGAERRLALVTVGNTVESVVTYVACLRTGNPILLAPAGNPDTIASLIATYDPDLVLDASSERLRVDERRQVSRHELHPDLALMLSTSGTTGSAKLVRLSHHNLQANAESIADYLDIRGGDRAATTLPMHYCYGLSVINSHLSRGAALILTDLSVSDTRFWELFRERRGTTFAGVPHTFELLDRVGFDAMRLPHLRYVTQAGGRLAPDRVRHYANLGRRRGWDLFVMYGQTEATARMAYLPPDLTTEYPDCVGIPIPGGEFRLDPLPDWPDPDTGELVYQGPNVMLGYAQNPADLGLGRTQHDLPTGDIARRNDAGLYQIIGRRSRFLKLFGLRVDLHRVEESLSGHGLLASCVGDDEELVVVVTGAGDAGRIQQLVRRECGLPIHVIRVVFVTDLPRLDSGKPDYPAIRAMVGADAPRSELPEGRRATSPEADRNKLREVYAEVLGVYGVTDDSTFVGLGGDSLSYVEISVRLEQILGHAPEQWPTTPIKDLRPAATGGSRRRVLDTSTALRAISIMFVVGTHVGLFGLAGGAHVLLGVAGYNFGRFHLTPASRTERAERAVRSTCRVVAAAGIWIGLLSLAYRDWPSAIAGGGEYWFIEALVPITAVAIAAIALADRVERRRPFALPVGLMLAGLLVRYDLVPALPAPYLIPRLTTPPGFEEWANPSVIFWLFAWGWAAAKATTRWQRLFLTAVILLALPGFFTHVQQDVIVGFGLTLLLWIPVLPGGRLLNGVAGVLAASSLYIYLTHWQIYPRLKDFSEALGGVPGVTVLVTVATVCVGVLYGAVFTRVRAWLTALGRGMVVRRSGIDALPAGDGQVAR